MDYKVLKQEQIREVTDTVLKNRAQQLSAQMVQLEIEGKRLAQVAAAFDEETAALLQPQIEENQERLLDVTRKFERANEKVHVKASEQKATRIAFLRNYLGQLEGEYAQHAALAAERQRVIESGELNDEELALVQQHWQDDQTAMTALDAAHQVVLTEMADLKIDPNQPVPIAPIPSGLQLPAPEAPTPKPKKASKAPSKSDDKTQ
jgi:hypothetical protein